MDKLIELLLIITLPVILLVAAILAFKQRLGAIRAGILLALLAILSITSTLAAYLTDISQAHKFEAPELITNAYQDIASTHLIILCIIAIYTIVKISHLRR